MNYHGILINLSQKNKACFETLEIIGKKHVFLNMLVLLKVSVRPEDLEVALHTLQSNMVERLGPYSMHFYCHFYREDELIVVFKQTIFHVKTDPATWQPVITYGRSLGIPDKQLDFAPCRFEDETY